MIQGWDGVLTYNLIRGGFKTMGRHGDREHMPTFRVGYNDTIWSYGSCLHYLSLRVLLHNPTFIPIKPRQHRFIGESLLSSVILELSTFTFILPCSDGILHSLPLSGRGLESCVGVRIIHTVSGHSARHLLLVMNHRELHEHRNVHW